MVWLKKINPVPMVYNHNDHKCQVFWMLSILAARQFTREQQWSECRLCIEKILLLFSPQHYSSSNSVCSFIPTSLREPLLQSVRAWKGQKFWDLNFIVYRRMYDHFDFWLIFFYTGQDLALKLFLLQKVEFSGKKYPNTLISCFQIHRQWSLSISQFQSPAGGGQRHGPQPPLPAADRQGTEARIVQGRKLADVPQISAWVLLATTSTYSEILISGRDRWDMAF